MAIVYAREPYDIFYAPSGQVYQAERDRRIMVTNLADQIYLLEEGCSPLPHAPGMGIHLAEADADPVSDVEREDI